MPSHHHYSSEGAARGGGRSWPRALPSVLCCHSKLRPLCFVQSCGDPPCAHSTIKNFPRPLVCLVLVLGGQGQCSGSRGVVLCSWDEAGPCAQGSPFLGLADAGGHSPKPSCLSILKTFPAFISFPRDLPTLPDPWRLLPSTADLTPQQSAWALATSFTDLKPLPSPAAGPRCFLLLQQLCSEAWGCLLSAWSRNQPMVEPDGYKKVKKVKPMQFNFTESEAFPPFFQAAVSKLCSDMV